MNANLLSFEIASHLAEDVGESSMSPATYRRVRSWLRGAVGKSDPAAIAKHLAEGLSSASLQKNEARATVFEGGVLKFEFGPAVPEKVRELALKWAKKRGLNAVEASLAKSADGASYAIFAASERQERGAVVEQFNWFC